MNWEKASRKSMEEENLQSVITHVVKFTLSTAHQSISLGNENEQFISYVKRQLIYKLHTKEYQQ